MKAINDLKLIGALSATPTFQTRSGTDVMEGVVMMETDVNGRRRATYVPFVVVGRPARALFDRVTAGSVVNLAGVAYQERWPGDDGKTNERTRFKVLRAEVIGDAGVLTSGENGPHLLGGKNSATIGGNVVAAPTARTVTVKETGENVMVTEFTLALNDSYTKAGVLTKTVAYLDVVAWRGEAQTALCLRRGQPVIIDGAVISETFTTGAGQKRSTLKFEAVRIFPVEAPGKATAPDPALPSAALPSAAD